MEGGPPIFRQDCSCPALLEDVSAGVPYGAVTRSGPPFQTLPVPNRPATGLVRFRSPLLAESRLMSSPPATEMFQFAGFASRPYQFRSRYHPIKSGGGLPHSETPGSPIARISPGLFAACRVLHRLSVPRHPPDALQSRPIPGCRRGHRPRSNRLGQTAWRHPRQHPGTSPAHRGKPQPGDPGHCGQDPRAQLDPVRGPAHAARRACRFSHSHEDTFGPPGTRLPARHARASRPAPQAVRLGHLSQIRFTLQSTPPPPAGHAPPEPRQHRRNFFQMPSARSRATPQRRATGATGGAQAEAPVEVPVEVNGIEPMTSCLQSRRSPN